MKTIPTTDNLELYCACGSHLRMRGALLGAIEAQQQQWNETHTGPTCRPTTRQESERAYAERIKRIQYERYEEAKRAVQ